MESKVYLYLKIYATSFGSSSTRPPAKYLMNDIYAPNEAFPTRTLLWICFVISLVLTAHWAIELYSSFVLADSISHSIRTLAQSISITDSTLSSSLEIEGLAVKLKIVNAAAWTTILKLSILWTALVSSLVIYPVLSSRLA